MSLVKVNRLNSSTQDFEQQLEVLLNRDGAASAKIDQVVANIIADVRQRGDQAVLEYTRKFDELETKDSADLCLPATRLQSALDSLETTQRQALETAYNRIRNYAEKQKLNSWRFTDEFGNQLGQHITPIERVGLYVPGGKASYPSSVLMNAIPAKVAGVAELTMVVPTPHGKVNPMVLAAAAIVGVDTVLTIGGAQAIAALAYGTATIAAVDKIVGPGNIYVATAKRMVFGRVGIDMVAGPSEIVIVSDGLSNPDWVAMDLFSQAEHDEEAQAILISPDAGFLNKVEASIQRLLPTLSRQAIISESLQARGALIQTADMSGALALVNKIAPEHLELSIDKAVESLDLVKHAGAIFLGRYAAEALGDYVAGPNHVLPTAGTARFASPLGVYDFQKRSSIIDCTAQGAAALATTAVTLAKGEGLEAHALSAEYRAQTKLD